MSAVGEGLETLATTLICLDSLARLALVLRNGSLRYEVIFEPTKYERKAAVAVIKQMKWQYKRSKL